MRLPALFATGTHLLGWQGLTVTLPSNWNLASFGGDASLGNLRADDEEGPRLELRWEQPKGTVDLGRSIEQFLDRLGQEAKKKHRKFEPVDSPRVVAKSRKRKAQLVNFGWIGEHDDVPDGQGWGVAWECSDCGRVVVAHLIGRGLERPEKVQRLATEVLSSLECHGSGGWQTWSVFDLQLEIPEGFQLGQAKLETGRLQLEWMRPQPRGWRGWGQRPERIALRRLALANVILENEPLDDWAQRVIGYGDKSRRFGPPEETTVRGHNACLLHGTPRDPRRRVATWCFDRLSRRRTPPAEVRVWHCEESNKIFVLDCELSLANAHVTGDVLDSLECHP